MSPKPGTKVELIAPIAVKEAVEADEATSGAITEWQKETAEKQKVELASVKVEPHKPAETQEEKEIKCSWVEVELVDEADKPVPGARYRVTLPDGKVDEGTLDAKGFVRIEGFEPGQCQVSFPDFDQDIVKQI
jgi:hypothetical protein